MNNLSLHIILYLAAFFAIWIGSGLAIRAVEYLARAMRVSSFLVSFFVLGVFTSLGELSVGISSILENDPEIFVGNLIGASIVLFMLVVPLLVVTGKNIKVPLEFQKINLPAALGVVGLQVVLVLDGLLTKIDSLIAIASFVFLIFLMQKKGTGFVQMKYISQKSAVTLGVCLAKLVLGVAIIFVASRIVVDQTHYFSQLFGLSPFLMSLFVISIGTNLPELSLVVRSLFMRSKQVAFGDFIGSAVFNTFLFGFLGLLYGRPIALYNSYVVSLIFLLVGLVTFYFFARSKNTLSRWEGSVLLGLYAVFLITEIAIH